MSDKFKPNVRQEDSRPGLVASSGNETGLQEPASPENSELDAEKIKERFLRSFERSFGYPSSPASGDEIENFDDPKNFWEEFQRVEDMFAGQFVDKYKRRYESIIKWMINEIEPRCSNHLDGFENYQVLFRGDALPVETVENPALFKNKAAYVAKSEWNCRVPHFDRSGETYYSDMRDQFLDDFLVYIWQNSLFAQEEVQLTSDEELTPVLIYGLRKKGKLENQAKNPPPPFWTKEETEEIPLENIRIMELPEMEENPESDEIPMRAYLKALLIANKIIFDVDGVAKKKQKELMLLKRKERRKKEELSPADYEIISPERVYEITKEVMEYIEKWHAFKPDYIFLTETSATRFGYSFKEAWKTAYPEEEVPKFYRVDPLAMGKDTNARELPGYEEKLEEFLRKRIKKNDGRIVIFDEQPVTGRSQWAVKGELMRKLGIRSDNILVNQFNCIIAEGLIGPGINSPRLTEKTPPHSGSGEYGYPPHHEYKSIDEVKFVGKISSSSENLNFIDELKAIGRSAGKRIKERSSN